MQNAACTLENAPADLRAQVIELQARLAERDKLLEERLAEAEQQRIEQERLLEERAQRIEQLLDVITLLKRKRFGRSADVPPANQLSLFDEAELEALIGELETEVEAVGEKKVPPADTEPSPPKKKPVRRPLPEHLPRVDWLLGGRRGAAPGVANRSFA